MKTGTGVLEMTTCSGDLKLVKNIVAGDKAEKNGACIGQINMDDASSFCGTMRRLRAVMAA